MNKKTKKSIANVFKGIIIVLTTIIFYLFLNQELYEPISAILREYSRTITILISGLVLAVMCVKLFGGILDEDEEKCSKLNVPSIIIIVAILLLAILQIAHIW